MKKMTVFLLCLALCASLLACGGEETSQAKSFRVGFGRVDITPNPQVGVLLDGYDDRFSDGMLNAVMATCVAITDEQDQTILLYTIDMCNTEPDTVSQLRKRLTESTGVPGDNITVSGTHTHSSPAAPYAKNYIDLLVQAGEEAMQDRAPATVLGGSYDVPDMNYVRHYVMNDGSYYGDNFGSGASGVKEHTTEADQNMRLIRFQREGKKDVLMVNWQVHPKVGSTNNTDEGRLTRNRISSDFIGFARDYVESQEDVLMAYYTGASGNVNAESKIPAEKDRTPAKVDAYGKQFGEHVIAALAELKPLETGNVGSQKAPLGAGGVYLHAYTVGGSLGFATVPAEIFDTTGMQIREGSPCDVTFVLTVANGRVTYIPPAEVFDYSSSGVVPYEVSICKYPRGTAETIAQDLVKMLTELQK